MNHSLSSAFWRNFLGHAPQWYKLAVLACLVINPLVLVTLGPTVAGWLLMLQFIATLVMALHCYPLQPGGLLVLQALVLQLTDAQSVYNEVVAGLPVILLMVFMVTAIHFLSDLLLLLFTRLLLVRRHLVLSLLFCASAALLSAFLDALTVIAVVLTVGMGFYAVYHQVASGNGAAAMHDPRSDEQVPALHHQDLQDFRGFLRGLLMHAAVGSALGGVMTQVGEPQNLLIAKQAGWDFGQFLVAMAPVTVPVLLVGLLTCLAVEWFRWFGYGQELPTAVRRVLLEHAAQMAQRRTNRERAALIVQALCALLLVIALALHWAEVGLIGLMLLVLLTSLLGVTEEHRLGKAFETALPFTSLLVVFFAVVAVIHDQHLFEPVMQWLWGLQGRVQVAAMYAATGVLSTISDNVFVASVYVSQVKAALLEGLIDRQQFNTLMVAVNVGTNIPSIATPNGQAALLFLLTSALAPLIRLSYGRMVWMALPYTVMLTITGAVMLMIYR